MKTFSPPANRYGGSAIVITLSILVLVTVLAVGLFSVLMTERITASGNAEAVRARALTQLAADHAVSLIRQATAPTTGKFWSSQPGAITVFNADGTVDSTILLASGSASTSDTNAVDLNQPFFGGNCPIASAASVGNSTPPVMKTKWIYLKDPNAPTSGTIGRYAFWVDDESAKINVNTADGTLKDASVFSPSSALSTPQASFGAGTPTEVSLQALRTSDGTEIPLEVATAIATQTGANAEGLKPDSKPRLFNDPSEILQIPGAQVDSQRPSALYDDNNFSLTTYNRSSELNIFGEPKIYLMTTGSSSSGLQTTSWSPLKQYLSTANGFFNAMTGPYTYDGINTRPSIGITGSNMLEIFPVSQLTLPGQLPSFRYTAKEGNSSVPYTVGLPQSIYCPGYKNENPIQNGIVNKTNNNYAVGMRIANYLKGVNSQGSNIIWPQFQGSDVSVQNFRGKYTDRQIDCITLQILDILGKGTFSDSWYTFGATSIMPHGFLSNQVIVGRSNCPYVNEVVMTFTTGGGNPPRLMVEIEVEWYMPENYPEWDATAGANLDYGRWINTGQFLNWQDIPEHQAWGGDKVSLVTQDDSGNPLGPGLLGGHWQNNMLNVTDQNGKTAGIDFWGNDSKLPDPDQISAQKYHANLLQTEGDFKGKYLGSGPMAATPTNGAPPRHYRSIFYMGGFSGAWKPGDFHCSYGGSGIEAYQMRYCDPNQTDPNEPSSYPITSINIDGGIAIWTHNVSGGYPIDPVPLDCEHGGPDSMLRDAVIDSSKQIRNGAAYSNDPTITNMRDVVLNAVIPIKVSNLAMNSSTTVVMEVADPMVNKFPGDWVDYSGPSPSRGPTLPTRADIPNPSSPVIYPSQYPFKKTMGGGANHGFKANNGKNFQGFWAPAQHVASPKTQRFPSTGYLQFIHTGIMPDPANEPNDSRYVANVSGSANLPKGTPFRLLNFSPCTDGTSQKTAGGQNYPDWAMLDLFTTTASFQPSYVQTDSPNTFVPNALYLTWGGATTGRMNPNSPIIPFPGISRTTPLRGALKNTYYNSDPDSAYPSIVDDEGIANAINQYISNLGRPLIMASEICNVPELAGLAYPNGSVIACNDIIRQIVGNLSTRSNTFTVWAVGQTLNKKMKPIAESRMKFVVERYLDYGVDGLPGNANPSASRNGPDGMIGTMDDVIDTGTDAYNPVMGQPTLSAASSYTPNYSPNPSYPLHYKYRILSATQINN